GELVDVIVDIFWIGAGLAHLRAVGHGKPVGDALFVHVGVAGKREKAGLLIFPAEPAYARDSCRFRDWDQNGFAANASAALSRLGGSDGFQRVVVDRLHEAVTQDVQRHSEGADIFAPRSALLRFCARGAVIHQRTAGNNSFPIVNRDVRIHEMPTPVVVTDAEFRDLADSARYRALMAVGTGPSVVDRSQPLVHAIFLFEGGLETAKGSVIHHPVAVTLASWIVRHRGSL